MKQFFAFLLFGLLMASCNNDPNNNGDTSQIVGSWKTDFISQIITETTTASGEVFVVENAGTATNPSVTYVFSENPDNMVASGSALVNYVITSISPANLFEPYTLSATVPYNSTTTWSLNGDVLTMTNNAGAANTMDVIELTDTKLHLKSVKTVDNVPNQSGGTSSIKTEIELKMTKQ